jgi:hypothetical protein
MTGWLYALVGAATGLVQVTLLVRGSGGAPGRLAAFLRIALVGVVLLLAARAGHFLAGALGWVSGFFVPLALARRSSG